MTSLLFLFTKPPFIPPDLTLTGRVFMQTAWADTQWRPDPPGFTKKRVEIAIRMTKPGAEAYRAALGRAANGSADALVRFAAATAYGFHSSPEDALWTLQMIDRWKPPVTPEWARLRFLAAVRVERPSVLTDVGVKVIRFFPEDDDVRMSLVLVAANRPNPDPKKDVALRELAILKRNRPHDPYLDAVEGAGVWQARAIAIREGRKEGRARARAALNRFLARAPKTHFYRPAAQRVLKSLDIIAKMK